MKRFIIISLIAALSFGSLYAKAPVRKLQFNSDGEFKIVQLTDLHLVPAKPEEAAKTLARIDYIIKAEKPDFIAITGDVIFGRPAGEMLQSFLDKLDSYKIPFAVVYGNHDAEQDLTRAEMSAMISKAKYSLNTLNKAGELADIKIPVESSVKGSPAPLDIYMLDSHDYSSYKQVGGYAWFTGEQIQWMREECDASTGRNGANVPSLAFFHIPFPEFYDAWVLAQEKKHNGVAGLRGEYGGHPRVNSGMYAAMLETGNVMGVFCGHDHDSDYIVPYYGIALAYGRFSGDDTVYNHLAHGTRIITVNENDLKDGHRVFRSWIHEDDGRIQYNVRFEDGSLK